MEIDYHSAEEWSGDKRLRVASAIVKENLEKQPNGSTMFANTFLDELLARVAELEEENERLRSFPAVALGCSGLQKRAERVETERDALRDRRCQDCRMEEGCRVYMALTANFYEPWSCNHFED